MATNSFKDQLSQALDFSTASNDPYGKSYADLKEIARSIEDSLNDDLPGTPIKVEIEPGFQATIGQQLRVNIRIPGKQFRDTLFRAYIPMDGLPIYLDLYGEEPERCDNAVEMQKSVLEFLKRLKDRMASYRDYATS